MKCTEVRGWLFRKLDDELSDFECKELDSHLAQCSSCRREYNLLSLPRQIAQATPPSAPSPFFYPRLKARIEDEAQRIKGGQPFWELARPMIPTLAGITLALFSVFAFLELRGPEADLNKAYERAFLGEDQSKQMLISEQMSITDESVLSAIAERQLNHRQNPELK